MGSPFGIRAKIRNLSYQMARSSGMASGSRGAQALQKKYDTAPQARDFYKNRVYDHIRPHMVEWIGRQREVFLSTADSSGDCDCSVKMGRPGFIRVLDEKTLAIPHYAGNGVHASLGNIHENPQGALCFYDPADEILAYQVNGGLRIVDLDEMAALNFHPPELEGEGRHVVRWLLFDVRETYARCNRHRAVLDVNAALDED